MHELAFNRPLVARAGGGMWRAPSVMELLHLDQRDAIAELEALVDPADYPEAQAFMPRQSHGLHDVLRNMAHRSDMYFGQQRDGWALYCCVQGQSRGAVWLNVSPRLGLPTCRLHWLLAQSPVLVTHLPCFACSAPRTCWRTLASSFVRRHTPEQHLRRTACPLAILSNGKLAKAAQDLFSLTAGSDRSGGLLGQVHPAPLRS